MQTSETRLEEFEITDENISAKKQFKTIIILFVIQHIIAIVFYFLPFISLFTTTTAIFTNLIFIIQLIIFRAIPVFALIKLISKKKIGWSLTIIFSMIDILQRIPTTKLAIEFTDLFSAVGLFFLASILILITSVILTYLLLKENIRSLFEVSNKRLLITILVAVIIFGLVRFLIAPYLINLALKTTH